MKLLITGCAGFIGFHLAKKRLLDGDSVIGIDNINSYYDPDLKYSRLEILQQFANFTFHQIDIADNEKLIHIFQQEDITHIINLAAQAGVRYSIDHPHEYIKANVCGFLNILEAARHYQVKHLIYASSSSVYGNNKNLPYSEDDKTDTPLAIYAATKKSNELMAHSYSYLYNIKTTGLRFFTVYGPWGRPDMAFFSFTKNILAEKPIKIYNYGKMLRDFTYIDDIVNGISLIIDNQTKADLLYNIYNIGSGNPVNLMDYINELEQALDKEAIKEFAPLQKGDVLETHADTNKLKLAFNYQPTTTVKEGIRQFVEWYKQYYL